jgi:hypothetical protein
MGLRAPIERPSLLWRGFVAGGVGTMAVLSVSDAAWEQWEATVGDRIPRSTMRSMVAGTVAVHLGEALMTRRLVRRTGLPYAGAYARTALIYGFPAYFAARRAAAPLGPDHPSLAP